MLSTSVIVLLVLILVMLAVGFYFIFTGQSGRSAASDEGVRIVGSERSIVSVRKVGDPGTYEVRVEDMPMLDLYEEGLFVDYEENLFDRWMRSDLSDEERTLLLEEIREKHGVDMPWDTDEMKMLKSGVRSTVLEDQHPQADEAGSMDEDEVDEEEVDPDTFIPVSKGKVNRFDGYDPFAVHDEVAKELMQFIYDSYRKGLLRPELLLFAYEMYGGADDQVSDLDIERLRREQRITGARVSEEVAAMELDEFDMYVHAEVAAAGTVVESVSGEDPTDVVPEDIEPEPVASEDEIIDEVADDGEDEIEEEAEDELEPVVTGTSSGYDWGDME